MCKVQSFSELLQCTPEVVNHNDIINDGKFIEIEWQDHVSIKCVNKTHITHRYEVENCVSRKHGINIQKIYHNICGETQYEVARVNTVQFAIEMSVIEYPQQTMQLA